MSEEEWESINIKEIQTTAGEDSGIVFIKCTTSEDSAKFTSKARNLPQTGERSAPRIIMHVDSCARARYRAFNNIARTIR